MKQCKNIMGKKFSMAMYTLKTLNQLYLFSRIKKSSLTNLLVMMVSTIEQTIRVVT